MLTFVKAGEARVVEIAALGLRRGPSAEATTLYRTVRRRRPRPSAPRRRPPEPRRRRILMRRSRQLNSALSHTDARPRRRLEPVAAVAFSAQKP